MLTNEVGGGIIVKLSGARATRMAAENRITTAFEGISGASAHEKNFKKISKKFLTNGTEWDIITRLSRESGQRTGPWKLNKTETCGTLNVGLETHENQFQIYK